MSVLPPLDGRARVDRLRAALAGAGVACDALLVTARANIRYLSGFSGSAGMLLVLPGDAVLVTDGRYRDQAEIELATAGAPVGVVVQPTVDRQVESVIAAVAGSRLGLEAAHVSWADQRQWAKVLPAPPIPTEGLVEALRQRKEPGEVARIAEAARIADAALGQVVPRLAEGPSEAELALELDVAMRRLGADDVSFPTIVASGPNAARPHARPGPRRIEEGDLTVIDFGALVDGYHSDMTRTFVVGEPSAQQRRMLDVVAASQAAGVAAVAAGSTAASVDAACRAVIADAGWADAFVHGTGHGVGLDIHEEPRVTATSAATLDDGHVVTIEPGVYLPAVGGVRIEDTVVVTDGGCRPLTLAPKDPFLP